ncbi:Zinc finger CCCH domain-containing protein, partial [Drosera capensis]
MNSICSMNNVSVRPILEFMELKASSPKFFGLSSVDYTSDPDEKEISDKDHDDRNHKHCRRGTRDQSPERDQIEQVLNRPCRNHNKPFRNHMLRESAANSDYNLDHDLSLKFGKRRQMGNYSRASSVVDFGSKLNQSFPGESSPIRGRSGDGSRYQHDSRFDSVDVSPLMGGSSTMFAHTGLTNVSNSQSPAWNSFGLIPGIPNGAVDAIHPLDWQGTLRSTLDPSMNLGIPMPPRPQCRDFEECGFCLTGDMCPMEHGVNRIVIDVQGLSQFNLPVSLASAPLLEMPIGAGLLPSVPAASSTMINRKNTRRNGKDQADEMFCLEGVPEYVDGSGTDVYDPDQPLWNNDDSQTLVGAKPSEQLVSSNGATTGMQNSIWGRIPTSEHGANLREKVDSGINFSAIPESEMQEVQVAVSSFKGDSLSGKRYNYEESALTVQNSSSKTQNDIGRHIKRTALKAQRTLFLNFIPSKDNKREALLAHFRKFGEVIDICIPSDCERAFVQFSRREEAEAALKAPDAVMGNPFIKLWWANRDSIQDAPISNGAIGSAVTQNVSIVSAPPISTTSKRKDNLSISVAKISVTHTADSSPGSGSKAVMTNGPKSSPSLQKKSQSLELLEEIRRKQELLDEKRNEFRRQLDKLEKQATGIKGEVPSEQACKRLKVGIATTTVKSKTPSSEPTASRVTIMAHGSVLEPQTLEKSSSSGGQLDLDLSSLPESSSLENGNSTLTTVVVDVPGTKHHLDAKPTTFEVRPPLPSGLLDVEAWRGHFSSFGGLSNVKLVNLEAQDDNHTSSDRKTIHNFSALASFVSRRAAEDAFRDGRHWNGHDLQFAWVHHRSRETLESIEM